MEKHIHVDTYDKFDAKCRLINNNVGHIKERKKVLKAIIKVLSYVCAGIISLLLIAVVGVWGYMKWQYHLPPPQRAVEQYKQHRSDFIRFATLIRRDTSGTVAKGGGWVDVGKVPEYRKLANVIGVKNVIAREDGSIDFALWGFGGPIMSDSYLGVRYYPNDHRIDIKPGWTQTVVNSLESDKLPQEHGSIATGLYVVPIEPEWFIYRFEYQE